MADPLGLISGTVAFLIYLLGMSELLSVLQINLGLTMWVLTILVGIFVAIVAYAAFSRDRM